MMPLLHLCDFDRFAIRAGRFALPSYRFKMLDTIFLRWEFLVDLNDIHTGRIPKSKTKSTNISTCI